MVSSGHVPLLTHISKMVNFGKCTTLHIIFVNVNNHVVYKWSTEEVYDDSEIGISPKSFLPKYSMIPRQLMY